MLMDHLPYPIALIEDLGRHQHLLLLGLHVLPCLDHKPQDTTHQHQYYYYYYYLK